MLLNQLLTTTTVTKETKDMDKNDPNIKAFEDLLAHVYGDGWEELSAKEICKLLAWIEYPPPHRVKH